MRLNIVMYEEFQVFLNYPFDADFEELSYAMHFAVVAAGLLPLCAKDLTTPDRPRLEMLVEAIANCHYSAHDFSKTKGEGESNFGRFNMPIEMGMALFHALKSQRRLHRCAFVVAAPHDYKAFASDLAGLDPLCYEGDLSLLANIYDWLRAVVPENVFNQQATVSVQEKYKYFKSELEKINGSGPDGRPTHDEAQELIYTVCSDCGWWGWRANKLMKSQFPSHPLLWK